MHIVRQPDPGIEVRRALLRELQARHDRGEIVLRIDENGDVFVRTPKGQPCVTMTVIR